MGENKMMIKEKFIAITVTLLFLAFTNGCGKKGDYENVSSSMKPEAHNIQGSADVSEGGSGETFAEGDLESLDTERNSQYSTFSNSEEYRALYGNSTAPLLPVYFDFDSSIVRPDQIDTLNDDGQYLLENKSLQLVIEGNCDTRGTADYNLALGEVRAGSVKKYLVALGVSEDRISTLSFGSERPLFSGNSEEDWEKNRRADLVIP